jgi:hypothetical protein
VNGGAWATKDELPPIATLGAGDHTVQMKREVSSATALEIESDPVEVKIKRATVLTIRVMGGILNCSYDESSYDLSLFFASVGSDAWSAPSDLSAITAAGTYKLRATLTPKATAFPGFSILLPSAYSEECTATKPEAPDVTYDPTTRRLSSTTVGAKFYYLDEAGVEHEVKNGDANELPGGVFQIYARLSATGMDMLHSENTPVGLRAPVFNLDIGFTLTPPYNPATNNGCKLIFSGCTEISSLRYTYEIKYYNAVGTYIGMFPTSEQVSSYKEGDQIIQTVTFYHRQQSQFEPGYAFADIETVTITVYIDGGTDTLVKSATMII